MDEDIVDLLREHANDEGMLGNDLLARCLWDSADEIERLRGQLKDCENDFEILSRIFDEVREERDQMKANNV